MAEVCWVYDVMQSDDANVDVSEKVDSVLTRQNAKNGVAEWSGGLWRVVRVLLG